MLHSGVIAAKLLSSKKLTSRKVHLVGAAGHEVPAILWPNPQIQLSSLLTGAHDNLLGSLGWQAVGTGPSPLPQLTWSFKVRPGGNSKTAKDWEVSGEQGSKHLLG